MKILLLNQFFWPDLAATSQLLTDVARELVARGHQVRVICGQPAYAGCSETDLPSVQVEYLPDLRFSKNHRARLFSYLSFWILCFGKAVFSKPPDVVVTLTTPPLLSLLGAVLKIIQRCRHVIWEMDMYPELAVELEMISRNGAFTRFLHRVAGLARRRADVVIALGECMRDRLIEFGMDSNRIIIAENWANGNLFQPSPDRNREARLTVVYPGNLGLGHDVETLRCALIALHETNDPKFLFIGGGKGVEEMKALCAEQSLTNCRFFPYEDPTTLARERFSRAHVGLVTQKESCSGLLVPSKVYPLMAAGLPFIFIGPCSATPNLLIRRFGCGWHISNGDDKTLVETLRFLAGRRDLVSDAGRRARHAFLERFDVRAGAARVCDAITCCTTLGPQHEIEKTGIRASSAPSDFF